MTKEPQYTHSFRFPIQDLKAGQEVLTTYSELAVYEPLLHNGFGADKDPFLRYVIYISEGSGLNSAIQDCFERRKEALRLAGVKPFHTRYHGALELSDDGVCDMWHSWLQAFCSRKFYEFTVLESAYYQTCRKVAQVIVESEDESKNQRSYQLREDLGRSLSPQRQALEVLESALFMNDDQLKRIATERAKPQAETGSIEEKIMKRNQK